jgi:hypothetical protein
MASNTILRIPVNSKNEVAWKCNGCGETGVITNWQGTLWDWTDKKMTTN